MTKDDNENLIKNRAWIEINLNNLEHNINEIKKILTDKTEIMAVIKANAYGHGIIPISKKLNEIGITDFAVATLDEAITLRKNNISGNILILGYTSIENLKYVSEYDLIQTIVDEEYAEKISNLSFARKLKTHIKINTGMNRIGIDYKNTQFIEKIYNYDNIEVLGIFSHLCVSDSQDESDIEFTRNQINKFNNLINKLENKGINIGKKHIQASYGLLNYNEFSYDYVRMGIVMFGINIEKNISTKLSLNLKPVLSLKARVTSVKEIDKDSYVGYGRKYKANKNTKLASISIGYADGYPRNLSEKDVNILINNQYGTIVGRICMDQLMADVSNIDNIKQDDIATLIGNDDNISMEKLAFSSKTITNELTSRLGERLKYIIIDK